MKPSPSENIVEFLNQGAFLNQVEFSNNGTLDSLTGAPAPKVFFENLAREISKSKRKFQPISIVMVQVLPDFALAPDKVLVETSNTKNKNVQNKSNINIRGSAYERELILVGRCLKSNMRGGDFYSRIADNGFWICLQGDAIDAQNAVNRFALKISEAKNLENKLARKIAGKNNPQEEKNLLADRHLIKDKPSINDKLSISDKSSSVFAICEWDGRVNEAEWVQKIDLLYFNS